ncbi:MAG: formate dehydrogenase accessory sulfurtransferase FdhD [Allorhizobium sp.]
MTTGRPVSVRIERLSCSRGGLSSGYRAVPEEVPIAFSFGGSTHAVMMATPGDLEDFAVGFSLAEGIIAAREDIATIDVVDAGQGIDVQIGLVDGKSEALTRRRRHMAGPVGCGLCGIESIEQAVRSVPDVGQSGWGLDASDIVSAVDALNATQTLHRETHAVHGAGYFQPGAGLLLVREDVGRHNALDKLSGAVLRAGHSGSAGAVVVTSRLSVEMVQKAAVLGSPVLIAISAPTSLAIRTAEDAGITLVAVVRGQDFEIFTHHHRINTGAVANVA